MKIYKVEWNNKEQFVTEETYKEIMENFSFEEKDLTHTEIELKTLDFFIYN